VIFSVLWQSNVRCKEIEQKRAKRDWIERVGLQVAGLQVDRLAGIVRKRQSGLVALCECVEAEKADNECRA
jgi:hypothetical protein